jgi:hypothetical protein
VNINSSLFLSTLSFLSITLIVSGILSIFKLSKKPDKSFLLFIFITKSQKSKSFRELYIVDIISTSAKSPSFPFQIISTSA